jgi:hypothetical protein
LKLYKYRSVTQEDGNALSRLSQILRTNTFWCAAPADLNDPQEFSWHCDYCLTSETPGLLAQLLAHFQGWDLAAAQKIVSAKILGGELRKISEPVIQSIVDQCRAELGVACFATSPSNLVMWFCYGGEGAGVCIELEVPDELLGKHLYPVEYLAKKQLHIDQLLQAALPGSDRRIVYSASLLTKDADWASEREVRFISKQQNISVQISGSIVCRLILGPRLDDATQEKIKMLVASLDYELPISNYLCR